MTRGLLAAGAVLAVACAGAPPELETDDSDTSSEGSDEPTPDLGTPDSDEPPVPPARPDTWNCLSPQGGMNHLAGGPPDVLSATRCFTGPDLRTPGPDLIAYQINSPLWSDGSGKKRWFVVPPGEQITLGDDGSWVFPEGSVIIKEFGFDLAGDAEGMRPIETRFMARVGGDWEFWTYRWNHEGTEARRVEGTDSIELDLANGTALTWNFPDLTACKACHSGAAHRVLGPSTAQMDREVRLGSGTLDQIGALFEMGILRELPPVEHDVLPDPLDERVPLEARARSYLHANCGHCHRPGGWVPPELDMDLRFDTPLAEARLCDVRTQYEIPFSGRRVDPGDPGASVILQRMRLTDIFRMPPTGTVVSDPEGTAVVERWIESLAGCP